MSPGRWRSFLLIVFCIARCPIPHRAREPEKQAEEQEPPLKAENTGEWHDEEDNR